MLMIPRALYSFCDGIHECNFKNNQKVLIFSFFVEEYKIRNYSISISLYLSVIQILKLLFTYITNNFTLELNFFLIISMAILSFITTLFYGTILRSGHKIYISLNEKDEEIIVDRYV
jgi:hypothetical protein